MLDELRKQYAAYVDTFRVGGVLPPMMELKLRHTEFVVENAKLIAAGEGFDALTCDVCEAAALLHDTGRYEQLKRYNTFQDSKSIDHAVLSHRIVKEQGWLDCQFKNDELKNKNCESKNSEFLILNSELKNKNCESKNSEFLILNSELKIRDAILDAVLYHNRRELPEGLDPLTLAASQTVRDADKLDIFRVLEHQIATTDWRHDCKAFWNLSTTARPSPVVIDAVRNGRPVEYQHINSLADFVLIQVGWIRSGLYYAATRRLCAERKHLDFRREFLHRLTDDPTVDELVG